MIRKYLKKFNKNSGFTHTPTLASLHSFLNIFSKKFNIFSYKQSKEVNERCNKKTMPKLVSGFTLVETLIAISIFSFSIVSLMTFLSQGIFNTNYAKNKIIAEYLAQEGIEYVRNMRDTDMLYPVNGNWSAFTTEMNKCLVANTCGFDVTVSPPSTMLCATHNACKVYTNSTNGYYTINSSDVYSGFTRTIQATVINANEVKIISSVKWSQGSGNYNITMTENVFNWSN